MSVFPGNVSFRRVNLPDYELAHLRLDFQGIQKSVFAYLNLKEA